MSWIKWEHNRWYSYGVDPPIIISQLFASNDWVFDMCVMAFHCCCNNFALALDDERQFTQAILILLFLSNRADVQSIVCASFAYPIAIMQHDNSRIQWIVSVHVMNYRKIFIVFRHWARRRSLLKTFARLLDRKCARNIQAKCPAHMRIDPIHNDNNKLFFM